MNSKESNRNNNTISLVATTFKGLENILAKEIAAIGGINIKAKTRAVEFSGNLETLYKANLYLRTAIRILKPLKTFSVRGRDDLYKHVYSINWQEYMSHNDTLAVDASVNSNYFNHSKYAALKAKDAIADFFRDKYGSRPSVDKENPVLRINIHISGGKGAILLDSSGDPLFKRGYRQYRGEAPLNEVLAAAMVLISGWDGQTDFIDPMCGSGTLLIEAAMIGMNIPPNYFREAFGFEKWPDFDAKLWKNIKNNARKERKDINANIIGTEIDRNMVDKANENINPIFIKKHITIKNESFFNFKPKNQTGVIITNPPYGRRLKIKNKETFFKDIGQHLKKEFSTYHAWMLRWEDDTPYNIGLKPSKDYTVYNAALKCKLLKFEIY